MTAAIVATAATAARRIFLRIRPPRTRFPAAGLAPAFGSGQAYPIHGAKRSASAPTNEREFGELLERAKGFEPSTPTLARSCSTPELHPHPRPGRSCAGPAESYAKRGRALQPFHLAGVSSH